MELDNQSKRDIQDHENRLRELSEYSSRLSEIVRKEADQIKSWRNKNTELEVKNTKLENKLGKLTKKIFFFNKKIK